MRRKPVTRTPSEEREVEYQRRMERLQDLKKGIADVVTARKRLELQDQLLDQRAEKERTRREAAAVGSTPLVGEARFETARESAIRALVDKGLLPRCRSWLNEQLAQRQADARFRLDLEGATGNGLGEVQNPRHEVPTTAYTRLARMLGRMESGSIGLAGPRGAGKTTLLASVCRPNSTIAGQPPRAAFVVAAPVKYSPLDFVAHVLSKLLAASCCRGTQSSMRSPLGAPRYCPSGAAASRSWRAP